MPEILPFCCQLMSHALGSDKIRLQTHKNCGEWVYGISADGGKTTLIQIDHCPFCGAKLKGGLAENINKSVQEKLEQIMTVLDAECVNYFGDRIEIKLKPESVQFRPSAASS